MKLTDTQKKQIEDDLAAFTNEYAGKTKEERKAKGQFFTPASLVIKMLEMFDCEEPGDQTILDPTAGNGNLLVGALIAGFKPENVYGNELDPDIYEMLVTRLAKYGVPKKNLVNMDCLSAEFKEWSGVMSFDLIIANPPYGKRGTLATTTIKEFMKFAEECVVLCQPRSIEKSGVYEHVVKADIVSNIFDAGLGKLAVSKIRNDYTEGKQVSYDKREMNEYDIEWWIKDFNKGKQNLWRTCAVWNRSPEKYKKIVEEKKSFFMFGCFELRNPITKDGNSTGYRYNVYKESVIWAGDVDPQHPDKGPLKNGKDCYAFDCESERAKNNFIAVYYDIPKEGFYSIRNLQKREYSSEQSYAKDVVPAIDWEHLDESPLWNISKEKAFLVELIKEGGQKIVLAYLKAKNENFDWNRNYTDSEILKEIGLPEDFLEK